MAFTPSVNVPDDSHMWYVTLIQLSDNILISAEINGNVSKYCLYSFIVLIFEFLFLVFANIKYYSVAFNVCGVCVVTTHRKSHKRGINNELLIILSTRLNMQGWCWTAKI